MITEIFVEHKRLDAADISSLLTFAIDDIRDFSNRSTTFSKTVVLPGTANNNAIFGNIFETGISNDYDPSQANIGVNFNASKSAQCIIFQDNLQTFKGTLRVLEIDIDKGRIEYQVALNGTLTTLSVALISKLLTDLDFSAYDQAYTVANIIAGWSLAPGSGTYYPMADHGNYSTDKHNWQFGTFRPALYAKEYIDKMFEAAGFRYESDLFNTERFKRFIIPHNQKDIIAPKTGLVLSASNSSSQHILHNPGGPADADIVFSSFTGGLFSTADNKIFTYNGATAISGRLTVHLQGTFSFFVGGIFGFTVQKSGVNYYADTPIVGSGGSGSFNKTFTIDIDLATGDTINIHSHLTTTGILAQDVFVSNATMSYSTPATVMAPVEYGETIRMNLCIPQNIRQIDFLVWLVKLSNLYVFEDQFDDRLIHIKPFINFYDQGAGSVVDWTYKLNRNQVIKVKPMSELNSKLYQFSYAKDSDFYNDLYQKRYNQVYGSFVFDTQFEFASNTTKIEVGFAPTPLVGYSGEEKVYPTIFKKSGTTEDRTDSVIRILQTRKVEGVASWQVLNGVTVLGSYTVYGYAGHYDDPDNPGNDLNFGGLSEIFYQLTMATTLDRTQFNVFWSLYMAELTDKDSKLVTAKFYLTPKDIFNLRFSQFITVDGVLYRLNKVADYNASQPDECEVELLRVINTNYRYPIGSTVDDDHALQWNDLESIMADDDDELLYE